VRKRVIGGEQDVLGAQHLQRPIQIPVAEQPTRRDVHVLPEILRDGARQFGGAAQHVGSVQIEQHNLTPVPGNDG